MLPSLRLTGRPAKNGARNSLRHSYPTGYPFPYSAAILREELYEVEKQFPKLKPMVIIGHSMGGCISRLLLTDSGDQLWMKIFGRPPDEVPLSPKTREYSRQELFFRHRPEIGRVIFIASPLRGSNTATGLIGGLATFLIREPTVSSQASEWTAAHLKSKQNYSLEEFGLTKQWIEEELGELIDFYKLNDESAHSLGP